MSRLNNCSLDDLAVVEINEAFAAVVLAWTKENKIDITKLHPTRGASALGTGTLLERV